MAMRERKDLNKALGLSWSDAPHEIRCEIPRRVTTLTMAAGVALIGFGIMIGSWPIASSLFFVFVRSGDERPPLSVVLTPLLLFGLFCFPIAGFLLWKGFLLLRGRDEIVIRDGRLSGVTRWGPLRSSRSCELDDLAGFRIEGQFESDDGVGFLQGMSSLVAVRKQAKPVHLLRIYPEELIETLAAELEEQVESFASRQGKPFSEELAVENVSMDPGQMGERTAIPVGSNLEFEECHNELRIGVPALGWRNSSSTFVKIWSILWVAATLTLTATIVPALIAGRVRGDAWVGWVLVFAFCLIAVASVFFLEKAAHRKGTIVLTATDLRFEEDGIFRKHQAHWKRSSITSVVAVAESRGTRSSGKHWIHFIKVLPELDPSHDWFCNRDKPELEWIATKLNRALGLDTQGDARS